MNRLDDVRRTAADFAISTEPAAIRRRVEAIEQLLENVATLPVINRRVGLDAILGLIPGVGDLVAGALGLYLVWEARNLGMPRWQLWRMAGHVGFDTLLGAVPLAGDVFDLLYRSNSRNLKIIKRHLDRHHPATRIIEGQA